MKQFPNVPDLQISDVSWVWKVLTQGPRNDVYPLPFPLTKLTKKKIKFLWSYDYDKIFIELKN